MTPKKLKMSPSEERKTWSKTSGRMVKATFDWTIGNYMFHSLAMKVGEQWRSDTFHASTDDKVQWSLEFYPKGDKEENKEWVSLYLFLRTAKNNSGITTRYSLSIWDPNFKKDTFLLSATDKFDSPGWGLEKFIKQSEMQDRLDTDGNLLVKCSLEYEMGRSNKTTSSPPYFSIPGLVNQPSLINDLEKLYSSMQNSDLVFQVAGRDIPAHKLIVCARSQVFYAMFQHDTKENQLNRVEVEDVQPDIFRKMLNFIYTDQLEDLTEECAKSLLVLADRYLLKSLQHKCEEFLAQNLTEKNCLELFVLADRHTAKYMKESALQFIRHYHSTGLMKTAHWKAQLDQIQPKLVKEILLAFVDSPNEATSP